MTDLDWTVRDVAVDEEIPAPDDLTEDESNPDDDEEEGETGGQVQ